MKNRSMVYRNGALAHIRLLHRRRNRCLGGERQSIFAINHELANKGNTRICSMMKGITGESYGVKRAEVAPNTTDLILKNLVVEPSLEFTLSLRGSSDNASILPTSENDEVLLGSECGSVERSVSDEGFEDFEVVYVHDL